MKTNLLTILMVIAMMIGLTAVSYLFYYLTTENPSSFERETANKTAYQIALERQLECLKPDPRVDCGSQENSSSEDLINLLKEEAKHD